MIHTTANNHYHLHHPPHSQPPHHLQQALIFASTLTFFWHFFYEFNCIFLGSNPSNRANNFHPSIGQQNLKRFSAPFVNWNAFLFKVHPQDFIREHFLAFLKPRALLHNFSSLSSAFPDIFAQNMRTLVLSMKVDKYLSSIWEGSAPKQKPFELLNKTFVKLMHFKSTLWNFIK